MSDGREQLIPVPLTLARAPTRGEIVAFAAALMQDETVERPDEVALLDQWAAAEADGYALIRGTDVPDRQLTEAEGITATVGRVVAATMFRHVEARCEHIPEWPPVSADAPRGFVVARARAVTCSRPACVAALKGRWASSGLCEVCDRPSDAFRSITVALATLFVIYEMCGECAALVGIA